MDDFEDELEDIFAEIRPCGQRLGAVSAEAAATGLTTDCVVAVARHDHVMGALATGSLAPGVLLDSMGSAEGLTLAREASTTEPRSGAAATARAWSRLNGPSPTYSAAFRPRAPASSGFAACSGLEAPHAQLIAEAEEVPPGCHRVTFVPDLRGRLSPTPDPLARGAWFGIGGDATRGVLQSYSTTKPRADQVEP